MEKRIDRICIYFLTGCLEKGIMPPILPACTHKAGMTWMMPMTAFTDFTWSDPRHRFVLSPRQGGRIISWEYAGSERVTPTLKLEGGLLRFLFGEERYPGASYLVPHQVVSREESPDGFRVQLRHYWNTPNVLMQAFGWPEKASRLHLDGLLLDKVISFDAAASALNVDIAVSNLTDEVKYFTPWLHNSFSRWASRLFLLRDGQTEPFHIEEVYWANHLTRDAQSMRCVLADSQESSFAVFGASTAMLAGYYGHAVPADLPEDAYDQASIEPRYAEVALQPGERWHSNAFLAMTPDWRQWATDAPVELFTRVEPAPRTSWQVADVLPSLDEWALPAEQARGLMILSYLDKLPFTATDRYFAANCFAGFHRKGNSAQAHVILYAMEDLRDLQAEVQGSTEWRLSLDNSEPAAVQCSDLAQHQYVKLALIAPSDLAGKDAVIVRISQSGNTLAMLNVPAAAMVEPDIPCTLKQIPQYLDERWRFEHSGFAGSSATELRTWQTAQRDRLLRYVRAQITAPCALEPRLLEYQEGPTCIREKVLIQTEPDFHLPAYVIYPKGARGKMPAVIFYHGSGPGKQNYASDEDPDCPRSEMGHELEYLPYKLAVELGCVVYVPDHRTQGELAETNPGQYTARFKAAGVDLGALMAWDFLCQVDYLCSRPDVDASRIGAYGASGGGNATGVLASLDERIGAAIVSSTGIYYLHRHTLPSDFFQHMRYQHPSDAPLVTESPVMGADLLLLAAPRPLWIMDGKEDIAAAAVVDPTEDLRAPWYATVNAARAAIGEGYALLGAEDRYRASWMEGGHCAGMTTENVVEWFRRWLENQAG